MITKEIGIVALQRHGIAAEKHNNVVEVLLADGNYVYITCKDEEQANGIYMIISRSYQVLSCKVEIKWVESKDSIY
jgi:hypothetical protein